MKIYQNRFRQAYLRKRLKRKTVFAVLMLIVLVVPYLVVARVDRPASLDCFNPANRVCLVSWADPPMYPERG